MDPGNCEAQPITFRLFTKESLTKIERKIQEDKLKKEREEEEKRAEEESGAQHPAHPYPYPGQNRKNEKPQPNPALEVGKTLPAKFSDIFPSDLYGKPIEDIDDFYFNKYSFMVVGKDKTIFRFSAKNALFILSPFNPVRKANIYVLTHPFFSLCVMIVILVNCVFMAIKNEIPHTELIFTVVYTIEGGTKILSRGFILHPFTYLRDAWNWLDFAVVSLAYITMLIPLGNLAALRTFRVLRALKTVAVVPGLKTIVGALMEAVRRLRDVMILTIFVLSIFALVGLQIYQGSLRHKCIVSHWIEDIVKENRTQEEKDELKAWQLNDTNWMMIGNNPKVCGVGECPSNFSCVRIGANPNYGYTNFDNFGWALLCAFRLMTQDYWENLYQLIIRSNGPWHMVFFVVVMLLGSFYLLNLILAIVAMSYDEQQKHDQESAEEEEEEAELMAKQAAERALAPGLDIIEEMTRSPSGLSGRLSLITGQDRRASIVNSRGHKVNESLSLPQSPHIRRSSRASQFSWKERKKPRHHSHHSPSGAPGEHDMLPLVFPGFENLHIPYIDSSNDVTPTSEDLLYNWSNIHGYMPHTGRRLSSSSHNSRMSMLENRFGLASNRRGSVTSQRSQTGSQIRTSNSVRIPNRHNNEPTHFARWGPSLKQRDHPRVPEVRLDRTKLDDNESSSSESECDTATKGKLFQDNPFIYRTPSATTFDPREIQALHDLVNHAMGKKKRFEGMSRKDYIKTKVEKFLTEFECCPCWQTFSRYVELFILDAFVDLFITLCILVNTTFMALDHAGMDEHMIYTLRVGNLVFTAIFAVEAGMKLIALGLMTYLKDKWNCFDITIVVLSLVELGLQSVKGLSILRSFRLLRVFKLAKSWPTLNLLIGIIGRTMGALGNLCFVLGIIVFIFAVMGMQLFGDNYSEDFWGVDGVPRWNFTDFLHSFMIVFRVLCGEWIESMWDCIHCSGFSCVPFFLLTMIIGNLVVLNLFLALLLSSFGAESLKQNQEESEPNKLQEAMDRINRFVLFIKSHIMYCIKDKIKNNGMNMSEGDPSITRTDLHSKDCMDGVIPIRNGKVREAEVSPDTDEGGHETSRDLPGLPLRFGKGTKSHVGYTPVSPYEPQDHYERECGEASTRPASCGSCSTVKMSSKNSDLNRSDDSVSKCSSETSMASDDGYPYSPDGSESMDKPIGSEGPEINEVNVIFTLYPDACCPKICVRNLRCIDQFSQSDFGKKWWVFRCYMFKLVEHKYFETFIITCILLSSLALAIEDIYLVERPILQMILKYMDKTFTVIFVLEMFIKWSAFGFKKYFTDAWCWLDFVIVAISLIMIGAETSGMSNMGAFRALRTLRALRPLRAVSRWEGMKVVVNALIQAIPSIFHVLTVCLVFWLIFSIMGVNLFGGRFDYCADSNGDHVHHNIVQWKNQCIAMNDTHNFTWTHPKINFDDALTAYLALLQIATFKGWIQIMGHAVDSQEVGHQPIYESKVYFYMYFVFFIVFGSFFTLNLFIGVIIDNFNMQKKKAGGSLEMFMTDDQKKYYNAMKKLGSKQPQKPIPKPRFKCQLFFFKLTMSQMFDIGIMSVILLNMITMSMEFYDQPEGYTNVLHYINMVFITIFTLECIMKLLGLRWYYFKEPWNVFDFIVVVFSLFGIAMSDIIERYFVSPTLLRVVRVFRVGRVLRLVKSAKGIRTLLFSLAVSLPALFNIGLLLFLVMFIYAIFGMNFFLHVKHTEGIDDMFNFETFGRSMIVLFQISTSAGWDSVLGGLMNDRPPGCTAQVKGSSTPSDCGASGLAIMFLVSYLVISFLVVINMYIAVILENFSQATEDVQQGLTQDDFDMFYEVWERFDEKATQYIPLVKVDEFVSSLEAPLWVTEPFLKYKVINLNIPICEDDRMHCVDILDALTKRYLGTGEDSGELGDIKNGPERKDYNPISTLIKRQHEIYVATRIQRRWRKYKKRKASGEIPPAAPPQPAKVSIEVNSAAAPGDLEPGTGPAGAVVIFEDISEAPEEEERLREIEEDENTRVGQTTELAEETSNPSSLSQSQHDAATAEHFNSPDDSKTVELFPESGVVA